MARGKSVAAGVPLWQDEGMTLRFSALLAALLALAVCPAPADAPADVRPGDSFAARDTLSPASDPETDAAACLQQLTWTTADFSVTCEPRHETHGDLLLRFPSALPSGHEKNDRVALEWYQARSRDGKLLRAPAVVVVHESGKGMVAGRTFARGLRTRQFHTFLIHLPGYGARRSDWTADIRNLLPSMRQAVADVRRARDAIAALPQVDASLIAVQGTSLGGFVTATVAGLDRAYQRAFILLAGGQLSEVLLHGNRDAAGMRRQLEAAGITHDQIRELSMAIEPMRLAHRVDSSRTWLFSGKFDEVVPPRCSHAFAAAAGLAGEHHRELPVGHYSAALLLPVILQQIGDLIGQSAPATPPQPAASPAPASPPSPPQTPSAGPAPGHAGSPSQ